MNEFFDSVSNFFTGGGDHIPWSTPDVIKGFVETREAIELGTMAKNRNKRKNAMAMDVSSGANSVVDTAQVSAMDTSETVDPKITFAANLRKTNKGRPMKRSKSLSKRKAIAKAISLTEKSEAKLSKNESKSQRTKQAKNLYD